MTDADVRYPLIFLGSRTSDGRWSVGLYLDRGYGPLPLASVADLAELRIMAGNNDAARIVVSDETYAEMVEAGAAPRERPGDVHR